jgi:hypothetical protein
VVKANNGGPDRNQMSTTKIKSMLKRIFVTKKKFVQVGMASYVILSTQEVENSKISSSKSVPGKYI